MKPSGRVFAVVWACVVASLFGCTPGRQLGIPYTSVEFATESRVLLKNFKEAPATSTTSLYDLAEDRVLWNRDFPPPDVFSLNGEYGARLEADSATPDSKGARVVLVDLNRGIETKLSVWAKEEDRFHRTDQLTQASDHLAVSDDGSLVAAFASNQVRIYATTSSEVETVVPFENAHVSSIGFLPQARGAVIRYDQYQVNENGGVRDDKTPYVLILSRSGARWEREAHVVAWSWRLSGQAVLFVTPNGIVRQEGRRSRLLVAGEIESYLEVSPSGRTMAFEYDGTLRVYQVEPPRQLFVAKVGIEFEIGDQRLIVFEDNGDLIRYGVPDGKARTLRKYGQRNYWSKNWLVEGATQNSNYRFWLGPAGRYGVYDSSGPPRIVDIDAM